MEAQLQNSPGCSECPGCRPEPRPVQDHAHDVEATPHRPHHVLRGYLAVLEHDLGALRTPEAHLVVLGADTETREVLLDDKDRDPTLRFASRVSHCRNDEGVGHCRPADVQLIPVQDELVALMYGSCPDPRRVRSCARLRETKAGQALTSSQRWEVFLLLRFCPSQGDGCGGCGWANHHTDRAVRSGEFFQGNDRTQFAESGATIVWRDGQAEQSEFCCLLKERPWDPGLAVDLLREGLSLLLHEVPDRPSQEHDLFGHCEVHRYLRLLASLPSPELAPPLGT